MIASNLHSQLFLETHLCQLYICPTRNFAFICIWEIRTANKVIIISHTTVAPSDPLEGINLFNLHSFTACRSRGGRQQTVAFASQIDVREHVMRCWQGTLRRERRKKSFQSVHEKAIYILFHYYTLCIPILTELPRRKYRSLFAKINAV